MLFVLRRRFCCCWFVVYCYSHCSGSVFVSCFIVRCFFVIILVGKGESCCFTLFVFLVSCDCYCSVALPHGAVGWSAVCGCGIS